ncbi:MAG: DUF4394 domain-containing protein [Actinomycetota bacterium]
MRKLLGTLIVGALLGGVLAAGPARAAHEVTVYGLTTQNRLLTFASGTPDDILRNKKVSGLASGESLVGIDVRPATGALYGVGKTSSGAGKVYTLDARSGAASFVASISVMLQGGEFGVDFNPVVDRIRVVSDADQSLAVNPDTGAAAVNGNLNYPSSTQNPFVTGAAYTNNVGGATSTVLYDIDAGSDDLVTQNTSTGALTKVADLGTSTEPFVGWDIRTSGGADVAYASFTTLASNGKYDARLLRINLSDGSVVTDWGRIGGPRFVRDIAVGS